MSKNTLVVALAENKRLREQVEYLEAKLQVVEQWHGRSCAHQAHQPQAG